MTAKTKAQLMARLRKQRLAAGLARLELWIARDDHAKVKKFAENLKKRRKGNQP